MSIQSEIDRIQNNVAETYSALEEQGATMPTQQNSDNLAATARTISSSSGGTTVQADLAVNDPANPRYVKNRTHWKEVYDGPEGEVIPETAVAFTTNIKTITGAMSDAIKVGGKYIVTWNGTDYECVGKASDDGNYIGNGSFMNAGSVTFEDTGEPFCVLQFGGTYYMVYKADKTAETITVKVVGKKETVWHKLDSRFLNEALQFGGELVEVLPETTVEVDPEMGPGIFLDAVDVTVGNTYIVNWNGTKYTCKAQTVVEDGITASALGNYAAATDTGDSGEPFFMLFLPAEHIETVGFGALIIPLDGSTSITLSIVGDNITKLDSKYLNEALQFGETVITSDTLTWDGDTDGLVCVEIDVGVGFCKVSDSVVTRDDCANGIVVTVGVEDIPFPSEDIQAMFSDDDFCCIEAFAFVPYGNYFWADIGMAFPEAGVYFFYADGMFISKLAISGYSGFVKREVKKLDNKYLDMEWMATKPTRGEELFPKTTVDEITTVPATEALTSSRENNAFYVVTWNGVEYFSRMVQIGTSFYLGNLGLMTDVFPNTGEPFIFDVGNVNLVVFYATQRSATFKIDRASYDTLPYDYAPASYTIPTDMKANDPQTNAEELIHAQYVLKHGGKVYGTVDGAPVEVLAVEADTVDWFHYITWRNLSQGTDYGNIYQQKHLDSFKAATPAVDRVDILLRHDNSYSGTNAAPKKFKFTVDDNGNLMSSDEDGTNQKSYMTATPVTSADNGKFLRVVDGAWAAVALTDVSEVGA